MTKDILYSGSFLKEGFQDIGWNVFPLQLDSNLTINELVERTGIRPDVVFIEFFGKTQIPKAIGESKHKLAAYCIDSTLNEYWLIPLMKLFDYVYVDQVTAVPRFRKQGVNAKRIPLCAIHDDFREQSPKKHFLTFVGRLTEYRTKRNNLIKYISDHFDINIVQDVTRNEMIDIFSASRIVLNENFFPGLNLRFFQALASGSLLLTERNCHGVNNFFTENIHYAGYSHNDIIDTLKRIDKSYDQFESIAVSGREECKKKHTATNRALAIAEDLFSGSRNVKASITEGKVFEAESKYNHARRFGGRVNEPIDLLHAGMNNPGNIRSHAAHLLGSIYLRTGNHDAGIMFLENSAAFPSLHGLNAALKLMLFFSNTEKYSIFLSKTIDIISKMNVNPCKFSDRLNTLLKNDNRYYNCCMLSYEILLDLNIIFPTGFNKTYKENLPDYAFEYASLAFEDNKNSESLDAIIRCLQKLHTPSEALFFIKQAILEGAASTRQILSSIPLALKYYDFSYAHTVMHSLKKSAGTIRPAPCMHERT